MRNSNEIIDDIANKEYEFGFTTDIEMEMAPVGLNEDTIRYISAKKEEPEWLLEWRLKGFAAFKKMQFPSWQHFKMPELDLQKISYYAAPKKKKPEVKKENIQSKPVTDYTSSTEFELPHTETYTAPSKPKKDDEDDDDFFSSGDTSIDTSIF